jgi:hypothetical protein
MRLLLRLTAAGLLAGALTVWVLTGRHQGWTKNEVFTDKVDEITGITYQETEKRFVMGTDLLGASGGTALVLAGLSFLRKRRKPA